MRYLLLGSCNPQRLLWKGPCWFKVCHSQTRETQRTATPVESPSLSHLNVNPLDLLPPSTVSHCPGFLIQIHLRSEMFVLLRFTFAPQGGHVMIRSKLLVCTWNQKSFRRFYYCYFICSGSLLHLLVIFYFCYINQYLFNENFFSFFPFLSLSSLILKETFQDHTSPSSYFSVSLFSFITTFFLQGEFILPPSTSPSGT